MLERDLILCSISIFAIGLLALFLSFWFVIPQEISSFEKIPSESLVSFPAIVESEYATQEGLVLSLSRNEEITAYLDSYNLSLLGKEVIVTGRDDGEWFSISELELIESKN